MAKFNFSNVLGGAVFGGLNAFLQHNASRDGYAKQNRYEVVILLPAGVSGDSSAGAGTSAQAGYVTGNLHGETARRISFRCNSISIPARSLRTQVNGNIYGPTHQVVQGQVFAPVEATFYCGSDLAERYFFEEWQKITYNPDTYDINYYKEYIGSIEIYQLNEQDERTYGCKLEECFPVTIGALPYGHSNTNQIQTISVEFAYRYWRNIATEPQKANLDSTLQDIIKNSILRNVQSRLPQVIRRLF
jgi:hypothetical protein|tara:strand:+ start:297 stop:1034 length:738 start_codon:yes stop_codon:yes gene_type:complete